MLSCYTDVCDFNSIFELKYVDNCTNQYTTIECTVTKWKKYKTKNFINFVYRLPFDSVLEPNGTRTAGDAAKRGCGVLQTHTKKNNNNTVIKPLSVWLTCPVATCSTRIRADGQTGTRPRGRPVPEVRIVTLPPRRIRASLTPSPRQRCCRRP